jgi:hypothetical protein
MSCFRVCDALVVSIAPMHSSKYEHRAEQQNTSLQAMFDLQNSLYNISTLTAKLRDACTATTTVVHAQYTTRI